MYYDRTIMRQWLRLAVALLLSFIVVVTGGAWVVHAGQDVGHDVGRAAAEPPGLAPTQRP